MPLYVCYGLLFGDSVEFGDALVLGRHNLMLVKHIDPM